MTCQRLVFSNFLYLLLESGGAFSCFPEWGTNAVTPRLKVAEAEGLVYFWSVSPMVLGGVVLYLTAEFMHSHAVLPLKSLQLHGTALQTPSHSLDISFHSHCPDLHIKSMNNKEQVFISGLNRIISYWKFESKPLTFKLLSALAGLYWQKCRCCGDEGHPTISIFQHWKHWLRPFRLLD